MIVLDSVVSQARLIMDMPNLLQESPQPPSAAPSSAAKVDAIVTEQTAQQSDFSGEADTPSPSNDEDEFVSDNFASDDFESGDANYPCDLVYRKSPLDPAPDRFMAKGNASRARLGQVCCLPSVIPTNIGNHLPCCCL